jgi:hypothetical protein
MLDRSKFSLFRILKVFIVFSAIIFFLILSAYSYDYILYIFNKPIDKNEYIIKKYENDNFSILVSKKIIENLFYQVDLSKYNCVNINGNYYYNLNEIVEKNNVKFIIYINKDTKIIDVNNINRKNNQNLKNDSNSSYNLDLNLNNSLNLNKLDYKKYETKYFILYYTNEQIKMILNNLVDYYYEEFIKFMGFSDYYNFSNFFGEKIPIYLAPNDDVYRSYDMVPEWSSGAFVINFDFYNLARASIYAHEKDPLLIQRVLPHEISHLVMYRYLNIVNTPLTFKFILEGVAQYQEYRIVTGLDYINYIPESKISFNSLLYPDFSSKENIKNFYDNSLSFTCFLINSYGIAKYREFIKELKTNNDVLNSINKVYKFSLSYSYDNIIKEIESKWRYYTDHTNPTPIN